MTRVRESPTFATCARSKVLYFVGYARLLQNRSITHLGQLLRHMVRTIALFPNQDFMKKEFHRAREAKDRRSNEKTNETRNEKAAGTKQTFNLRLDYT